MSVIFSQVLNLIVPSPSHSEVVLTVMDVQEMFADHGIDDIAPVDLQTKRMEVQLNETMFIRFDHESKQYVLSERSEQQGSEHETK